MGTGKDSDKPGKSAGTSYQEPDKLREDVGKLRHHSEMGGYHPKQKTPPKETFVGDQ